MLILMLIFILILILDHAYTQGMKFCWNRETFIYRWITLFQGKNEYSNKVEYCKIINDQL